MHRQIQPIRTNSPRIPSPSANCQPPTANRPHSLLNVQLPPPPPTPISKRSQIQCNSLPTLNFQLSTSNFRPAYCPLHFETNPVAKMAAGPH